MENIGIAPTVTFVQQALQRAPFSDEQKKEWSARILTLTDDERRQALELLEGLAVSYKEISEGIDKIAALAPLNPATLTPEQVINLTEDQLALPETLDVIREHLRMLGYRRHGMRATQIQNALRDVQQRYPKLEQSQPRTVATIDELIALAQFFHLSGLSRLQRRNIFQSHLLTILKEDVDVVDAIDDWLLMLDGADGLGEDLEEVVAGIRNNKERIGSVFIDRGDQGTLAPTIQNWLIDYDFLYPREKTRGPVEAGQYLTTRAKTIQQLTSEEQEVLKKLIHTVDALLFPERHGDVEEHDELPRAPLDVPKDTGPKRLASVPVQPTVVAAEPKTLEDKLLDNFKGSMHIPGQKKVTIPLSVPSAPSAPSAVLQLRGQPADERKIEEAKQRLRAMGPALVTKFHDVIAPSNGMGASRETHIAALFLLAEMNKLEDVIRSQGMRDWMMDYLKAQKKPELVEGFRISPTSPKFMRLFLAWMMQERAGLSEAEAARFGARIANNLRKNGNDKFSSIAYYDEGKARFVWGA